MQFPFHRMQAQVKIRSEFLIRVALQFAACDLSKRIIGKQTIEVGKFFLHLGGKLWRGFTTDQLPDSRRGTTLRATGIENRLAANLLLASLRCQLMTPVANGLPLGQHGQ